MKLILILLALSLSGCASTLNDVLTKSVPVGTYATFNAHVTTTGFGWADINALNITNTGSQITAQSLKVTIDEPVYGVLTYDFTQPVTVPIPTK
jgi:hypothetical protein